GLYGETTDKVVTNFGFAVIAFFPLLILILSLIQWGLDRRKERRKAAAKARRGRAQWTGGWEGARPAAPGRERPGPLRAPGRLLRPHDRPARAPQRGRRPDRGRAPRGVRGIRSRRLRPRADPHGRGRRRVLRRR